MIHSKSRPKLSSNEYCSYKRKIFPDRSVLILVPIQFKRVTPRFHIGKMKNSPHRVGGL
jgi:hypothetical protein